MSLGKLKPLIRNLTNGNNRIGDLHNANDKVTQADLAEELEFLSIFVKQ